MVRCRGREKFPLEASDVFREEEEGQNSKEVNCSWVNVDFCSAIALAIASRTVPEDTLKDTFNNRSMHSNINWKSSSFNHSCCPIYLHILNIARHKTRITTFSLICTLSTLVNTNNGNILIPIITNVSSLFDSRQYACFMLLSIGRQEKRYFRNPYEKDTNTQKTHQHRKIAGAQVLLSSIPRYW